MDDENEVIIDVSTFDPHFRDEIAEEPGGEHIRRCFSCGTCTAGCPVGGVTEKYNPRRIVHMALLGMREQVLTSEFAWLCSVCYTCYERCPQDVRIPELMNAVRNIAVREGHVPRTFHLQLEKLRAHGRLYEIEDYENARRAEYDLPPIHEETAEVRQILDAMGAREKK
ncbi:MAG: 4Fe-4S dicluster domain-containing protein [Anaerolineae bacterium]|nr:MAG: 4Fe-4S dicluster domain-containing protein [Anaerolineae bacterium]